MTDETERDIGGAVESLFGGDNGAAEAALALLLDDAMDGEGLAEMVRSAQTAEQFARLRAIIQHHVLTRLRQEELADLEDDTVLIGFQFSVMPTAGRVGAGTDELVEQYPWGAQVSSTTAGFPGFAYLRVGDMIVAISDEPIPQNLATGQQFIIDTVKAHTLDQHVAMTVIRNGQALELRIPLARAAALPEMYDARTVTRNLIDPFLFLWEEAWADILLDAGFEEDQPPFSDEGGTGR
ncbi:hypothetical protein OT109_09730 [Phycisphaeraceae bacterium D3-23]